MMVLLKTIAGNGYGFSVAMTRVGLLLLSTLGLLLPMITAVTTPAGYISIDCGSTTNYTDDGTGLYWSTDDGYISTGTNEKVTALFATDNAQQVASARYFNGPQSRKKNCYLLPATFNTSYLIRAFFLYGDLNPAPSSNLIFDLSIDSTIVETVSITPSNINDVKYFEYVVASTNNHIDFCVIPVQGSAFISSLELRPLLSTMYSGIVFGSKYTKALYRFNCGVSQSYPTIRFPNDTYDRLWTAPGSTYDELVSSSTDSNVLVRDAIFDNPPMEVMQTAWSDIGWFTWLLGQETASTYYTTLYVADIGKPTTKDLRSVNIDVNGYEYMIYNYSTAANELWATLDRSFVSNQTFNFSFVEQPDSTLPPVLNAAELHAIYPVVTTTTATSDVSALNDLLQNLNLMGWTGDPCLPVSWDWVNCSNVNPPTIIQLKLSGYNLTGTIPASIADLNDLTDLWLDNNFISGSIPNLASLSHLQTLHLQNNSLTGPIPASLAAIPNLSELFLEGNDLSGPVPAGLENKAGLVLLVDSSSNSTGQSSSEKKKKSGSGAVIGAIVGVVVVVFILVIGAVLFFCCRRKNEAKTQPQPEISLSHSGTHKDKPSFEGPFRSSLGRGLGGNHRVQSTRAFSRGEVMAATDNFRQQIGEGGFGPVYYGRLATGEEVAVKKNSDSSGQGLVEFSTEVKLLSRVHHRNLVSLVGFCDEGDEKILIYEYMQNGNIREHLYGRGLRQVLDWPTRLNVALNAARGLEYLHYDCSPKIIHRDVKSNNILLNEQMLAKVADFGISKLAPDDDTTAGVSTVVRGTAGYLDPEYFSTNKLTQRSDVYAFGVVILEIISGRAPNDNRLIDSVQWNLVQYARRMVHDGNLEGIVDPLLKGSYNTESMWKLAELAMYCVEPLGMHRPDMRQVVRELLEAIDLQERRPQTSPITSTSARGGGFPPLLDGSTHNTSSSLNTNTFDSCYHTHDSGTLPNSGSSDSWSKPRPR